MSNSNPHHQFLSYGRQTLDEADIEAVCNVLRSDFLTMGPAVELFEQAVMEYTGAKFAVAVSSGTAALHLACMASGIETGQFGLVPAITFVASANAFVYSGAEVIVGDINEEDLGLSRESILGVADNPDVRVVMPVYMGGLASRAAETQQLAKGKIVIEDASHAFGGEYEDGQKVGSCAYSDMCVFSFHPVKPFTTGEGGMITTNDPELARKLRIYRNHGIERSSENFQSIDQLERSSPWYYEQQELGYNYRLSDLHAALGASQIKKIDGFRAKRNEIARYYDEKLSGVKNVTLLQAHWEQRERSAHHLYIVWLDFEEFGLTRSELMKQLAARGVGSQVHYIPLTHHPFHKDRKYALGDGIAKASEYYLGCLSLPIQPGMNANDAERVVVALKDLVEPHDNAICFES